MALTTWTRPRRGAVDRNAALRGAVRLASGWWQSVVCRQVLLPLAVLALTGCMGDDGSSVPRIASFQASPDGAPVGGTVELRAVFSHGQGRIEPGVGAVTSGVPVPYTLQGDTRLTLTVVGPDGRTAEAGLWIPVVLSRSWDFDGQAPDWVLSAGAEARAEVDNGALVVMASQYNLGGECTAASAALLPSDTKFQQGGYDAVAFRLDMRWSGGTGMGYPSIDVSYGGRILKFLPGDFDVPTTIQVTFDRLAGSIALQIGDRPVQISAGDPWTGPFGIVLSSDACAADLESESMALDALTISGR